MYMSCSFLALISVDSTVIHVSGLKSVDSVRPGCLIHVVYDSPEWSAEGILHSPVSICCVERRVEFPLPLGSRIRSVFLLLC